MIVSQRVIDILRKAEAIEKRLQEEERLAAEAAANQDDASTARHPD